MYREELHPFPKEYVPCNCCNSGRDYSLLSKLNQNPDLLMKSVTYFDGLETDLFSH